MTWSPRNKAGDKCSSKSDKDDKDDKDDNMKSTSSKDDEAMTEFDKEKGITPIIIFGNFIPQNCKITTV